MRDPMRVQVLQYDNHLGYIKHFDLMAKFVVVIFDKFCEASSFAVFHDKIKRVGFLKSELELHDSRVFDFGEELSFDEGLVFFSLPG